MELQYLESYRILARSSDRTLWPYSVCILMTTAMSVWAAGAPGIKNHITGGCFAAALAAYMGVDIILRRSPLRVFGVNDYKRAFVVADYRWGAFTGQTEYPLDDVRAFAVDQNKEKVQRIVAVMATGERIPLHMRFAIPPYCADQVQRMNDDLKKAKRGVS